MKLFWLAFFVIFLEVNIYAQSKIVNEVHENKLSTYTLETHINYLIEQSNGKKYITFPDFMDESKPDEVSIPSQDLFIAIPVNSNPKVSYTIINQKKIDATPGLNPKVEVINDEIIYSKTFVPKFSKSEFLEVMGKLWIENNYCLHIKINPILLGNGSEVINIEKFDLKLTYENEIKLFTKSAVSKVSKAILNEKFALNVQTNPKLNIKKSDEWIDYSKNYLKIGVNFDGIYRLNTNSFDTFGIGYNLINPKTFKLFLEGEEIPIFVQGESDLSFDSNDYIEFVGKRNMGGNHREVSTYDTPYNEYLGRYTDTTIYWLTWDGIDGKRIEINEGNNFISTDTLEYYSKIEHYEKNNWFDFSCASLTRRETPFWIENKTWHEGNLGVGTRNSTFVVSNIYSNKPFSAFVKLQDFASNISYNSHLLTLRVNSAGNWSDSTYIDKYEQVVLKTESNSNILINGNNTLNISSLPTLASINTCIFDWYEVEYPRYLIPINGILNFTFPFIENSSKYAIKLQNLSSENFSLWKYGENYQKFNVSKLNDKISFVDSLNQSDKYIYMDESKILAPKIYYTKQFTNLRSSENKADYVAITHKKFKNKVDEYSQFIADSYDLTTKVIDIDDIYDEYAFGFFNPEAIKDFLMSTHEYWQDTKPKYVTLIGGTTYDYYGNKFTNFSTITKRVLNYVPSYGASVSDNWFVTWDTTGAYIPQMNIGRIPVTTEEELDWYFEKHRNYLSQDYDDWNKKYLFFSGGNPTDQSQLDQMREANQFVIDNYLSPNPIGGKSNHFYKTNNPLTNFGPYSPEYVQNTIDDGAVFISYLGHSGTQTWDNSITSPIQLKNNKNRYPIVSDFGCSTARFAEPDVTSFSQLFTIGNDGQALGYVGNSSLGFVTTSLAMPKLFYKKILAENIYNVSESHKYAKIEMLQTYGSTGIYELFALTNTLIGDPVISLLIPPKPNIFVNNENLEVKSTNLTDLNENAEVKIRYYNLGKVLIDSLDILVIDEYQSLKDSNYYRVKIPSFSDSLSADIKIKNKSGNHIIIIYFDPENKIDEISEEDNLAQLTLNVASSAIRPIANYTTENGFNNVLRFINPTAFLQSEEIIFEVSNFADFSNSISYNFGFDTLYTDFNLNSFQMDNEKRIWGRTSVKGDLNYSTAFSFKLNDYNFLLSDSLAFNKSTINGLSQNSEIKIDSTKINFQLFSAGYTDGKTASIEKNGLNYIPESTITGHHVVLFNVMEPYDFVSYHYFNTLAGGTYITNYIALLDTLSSNYLVAIAISDEGTPRNTDLIAKIKSLGSVLIDKVGWRASWAFIGKKGAIPGTMPEAYSKEGAGPVSIDTTISFLSEKGSMLTSEIGPTGKWDRLVVSQEAPSNSIINYTPIGIKYDGSLDTLTQLALVDSVADLSHINSDIYPKIKILADFIASDDKQSPVLKSLGVDYNDVAELAINYQVVSVEKDSIYQGEKNKLKFSIYNVGETKADSVSVKIELQKPDNSKIVLNEFVTSVDSSSKVKFEFDFEILNSYEFGNMAYLITVDENNKITEFFKDNNFYQIPFYVKKDTSTNVNINEINVKFDGYEIMDGDFVSNKPFILFELNYADNFPIEDTTAINFTLDNKKVYVSNMNVDYDTINKTASYSYEPELSDGNHYLKVTGNSFSLSSDFGIDKLFTVTNELKALDIYNYPNPASDVTHFTFRLAKVPESLEIKIYTIAGRLIKVIPLKNYDLKTDINKIYWDLTDEDGDKISNGIYLYKLILRENDKVEHYTQKIAVVK